MGIKKTKDRIVCAYRPNETMGGGTLWETACGYGLKEAFKYCPHCGGVVVKEKELVVEKQLSLE
jgi:hypothetical protein